MKRHIFSFYQPNQRLLIIQIVNFTLFSFIFVVRLSNFRQEICKKKRKKKLIMVKLPTVIKVNQMRSLDLDFRLKIRIFDLKSLRCFESKNFSSKSCRNSPNLKLLKAKFFHLMILSNFMKAEKICQQHPVL